MCSTRHFAVSGGTLVCTSYILLLKAVTIIYQGVITNIQTFHITVLISTIYGSKKMLPYIQKQYLQHALEVLNLKLTQKWCAGNQQVGCPNRLSTRELIGGVHAAGTYRWHAHKHFHKMKLKKIINKQERRKLAS